MKVNGDVEIIFRNFTMTVDENSLEPEHLGIIQNEKVTMVPCTKHHDVALNGSAHLSIRGEIEGADGIKDIIGMVIGSMKGGF